MNDWGIPISKDKIIARRNRLIEYQKVGELRFTPLYEAIDENILDINYMLHEIENLQSKIDKAIEYCEYNNESLYTFEPDYDYEENIVDNYEPSNFREDLLDNLKEEKPKETKELFEGTMNQLNDLSILKEDNK